MEAASLWPPLSSLCSQWGLKVCSFKSCDSRCCLLE